MQSISDSVPNQDLNCASPSTSSHMLNNSAMDSVASVAGNSNDFKNLTSLGEVQRIIGLSLSKIQLGRNQRGGLPLHKNLLVATVLNKARDLYMQETMYMNYKMMVNGQFAAAAASASGHQGVSAASNMMQAAAAGVVHQSPYGPPHGYHYQGANHSNACDQEDLEPQTEANEADYDEDSESDVEDECDQPIVSSSAGNNNNNNNNNLRAVVGAQANLAYSTMQQQQHNNQVLQSPGGGGGGMTNSLHSSMPLQPNNNNNNNKPLAGNSNAVQQQQQQQQQNSDEGFIEDPDCDCDARNYGTSESRVPFQYCYHCAPFHPSNGRGPTLVPSPSCPSSPGPPSTGSSGSGSSSVTSNAVSSTATTSMMLSSSNSTVTSSTMTSSSSSATTTTTTLYDMDAQVTHAGQLSPSRGTKRCRSLSLDTTEDDDDDENDILDESTKKKRRESSEDSSSSSPDTSLQDESGYQSDSSQHEMFHPAFRGATSTPTSETCNVPGGGPGSGGQTMEIDQITSLVSIFSFGQQIMAAAAAANKSTRTSTSVGNTMGSSSSTTQPQGQDLEDAEDKKGEAGGGGPSSEDSDSESDTSSDSGHSSDDHEAAKEAEELSSSVVVASSQPPDLCATTVPSAVASEAPPCVEVASL